MLVYEALAKAFAAEGVDTQFGLMGDGNMHWMSAMDELPGMTTVSVRHEHCAVLMAIGYWSATRKVGIASVTHGPGFTQIMTALVTAARNHVPLIVFAGETSRQAAWGLQDLDQAPLATACGADYVQLTSPKKMFDQLREAFLTARTESKPVVVGVPLDLQKMNVDDLPDYRPSTAELPPQAAIVPDDELLASLAERLLAAKRPVLVSGRGGMEAGAGPAIREIADQVGGLLGTTLLAKGLYDDHPFSLGIVGGYARQASREAVRDADLVIAFGAQLSRFTLDNGKLFPNAHIVQIDLAPKAYKEGMVAAHELITGDARLAAERLLELVKGKPAAAHGLRTDELARSLREGPADPTHYDIPDRSLDPRRFFEAFETIMPADYHLVSGSAHQAYWHTAMRGQPAGTYHAIRAFGAIGNALSFAIGVAVGRDDGKVVLVEGDGGFLMHVQELETMVRHGIKLLVICINDGAFGAEIHKLRAENVNDRQAVFGRPGLEGVSRAFGMQAATVTDLSQLPDLMAQFEQGDTAAVWDVHVSDRVMTPVMRDEVAALRPIR